MKTLVDELLRQGSDSNQDSDHIDIFVSLRSDLKGQNFKI